VEVYAKSKSEAWPENAGKLVLVAYLDLNFYQTAAVLRA
jgi:hypothetical protein